MKRLVPVVCGSQAFHLFVLALCIQRARVHRRCTRRSSMKVRARAHPRRRGDPASSRRRRERPRQSQRRVTLRILESRGTGHGRQAHAYPSECHAAPHPRRFAQHSLRSLLAVSKRPVACARFARTSYCLRDPSVRRPPCRLSRRCVPRPTACPHRRRRLASGPIRSGRPRRRQARRRACRRTASIPTTVLKMPTTTAATTGTGTSTGTAPAAAVPESRATTTTTRTSLRSTCAAAAAAGCSSDTAGPTPAPSSSVVLVGGAKTQLASLVRRMLTATPAPGTTLHLTVAATICGTMTTTSRPPTCAAPAQLPRCRRRFSVAPDGAMLQHGRWCGGSLRRRVL